MFLRNPDFTMYKSPEIGVLFICYLYLYIVSEFIGFSERLQKCSWSLVDGFHTHWMRFRAFCWAVHVTSAYINIDFKIVTIYEQIQMLRSEVTGFEKNIPTIPHKFRSRPKSFEFTVNLWNSKSTVFVVVSKRFSKVHNELTAYQQT